MNISQINDVIKAVEELGNFGENSLMYWLSLFVRAREIAHDESDKEILDRFSAYLKLKSPLLHQEIFENPSAPKQLWQLICWSGEPIALACLFEMKIVDKKTKNETRKNILHFVARSGSVAMMDEAVELGVDPKAVDRYGNTVLHVATSSKNVAAMEKAVARGVDVYAVNNAGSNALHMATLAGSVAAMEKAIEFGINPKDMTYDQQNLLHLASSSGEVAAIEKAIALGFTDFSLVDSDGVSAFHYAIRSRNLAAVEKVLQLGVDPTMADEIGINMLHYAATLNDVSLFERAIELNVDPFCVTIDNTNLLHIAARGGNVEMMQRAIDLKVDVHAVDNEGMNVLHYAAMSGSVGAIDKALALGLDPSVKTNDEFNILHLAAEAGSVSAMLRAIELGLDPKSRTAFETSILDLAVCSGNQSAIVFASKLLTNGITNSQIWFMKLMKELGLGRSARGMCFGVTQMAIHAALLGEMDEFDARIRLIHTYAEEPERLKKEIEDVKQAVKNKETLTEKQEKILDIQVFFEGVESFQSMQGLSDTFRHKHLGMFQKQEVVRSVVIPARLENDGGKIDEIGYLENKYEEQTLETSLQSLKNICENAVFPVAIHFARVHKKLGGGHSICLSYNPRDKSWIFTDANTLPSKRFEFIAIDEVKKAILAGFRNVSGDLLQASVYVHNNPEKKLAVEALKLAFQQGFSIKPVIAPTNR